MLDNRTLNVFKNTFCLLFSVFYYIYIFQTLPNIAYIGITIISILKIFEINHLTVIVNRVGMKYWKDEFDTNNFNRGLKRIKNSEFLICILLICMISLLFVQKNIISNLYIDVGVLYVFMQLIFEYCHLHWRTKNIYVNLINDLDI